MNSEFGEPDRPASATLPDTRSRAISVQPKRSFRALAKTFVKKSVVYTSCGLNGVIGSRAKRGFGILLYHRVVDPVPGFAPPTWNVTPSIFRAQMEGLLARGFQPWPLRRLIDYCARGAPIPRKTFAVTFDDGHESVYRHAWPVLKDLNIPATLFLTTDYIDGPLAFPYDDWEGAGSDQVPAEFWRAMNTSQCLTMAADDLIELGAHTHSHQDFCDRPQQFADDLAINAELLRAKLGIENPAFAFPFGRATAAMMDAVREAGMTCGLTAFAVMTEPTETPFGWGRFNVESWDTATTLAAKMSGWYGWAQHLRRMIARSGLTGPAMI
jgi:peptidoglycan/xylan/chitin deacetylase (PgdA/CDA1 family)